ncbi:MULTISPECIES: hypothetical protein [Niastella]|uniref:Uncharacterized protein n=1 Tax=Niastella soli TaxID=2821487 RepID=A0ABS3Z557_9BACT|nr:hypothetical protein [Niastella soli]MBO9205278.1 hypothetical protein [Niastella soli]
MSEQLYFFKFNKEIARTKLSTLIKEEDNFSYKQYLIENNSKYEKDLQFDNIINKIEENIELLSTEELWSLYLWFSERTENGTRKEMRNYGLDLFFELHSKTPVRNFHALLWDYEFLSNQDIEYSCGSDELIGFLNYIICYSGELMIFLNKYYYKSHETDEETLRIEQLISDINSTSNSYFHILALLELENSTEFNKETMQLVPKLIEFRQANQNKSYTLPVELHEAEERESKIINLAYLLYLVLGLKEEIENYDGKIIRLHSV